MNDPYYDDGKVTIYHGDALDVLGELSVAETTITAMVTDPPYASGARTEAQKRSSGAMVRGAKWNAKPIENDQMTTAGFLWLLRAVLYLARGMLPDGGQVLSFIDWRQWPNLVGAVETCNLRVQGMIVWDKMSMGLGNGFRVQHELVLHASKGTPTVHDKGVPNVLQCKREANDYHPSPKPIPLMTALLQPVCPPGGVVLDPFMGAGSTLVAAKQTGRRAIGIECVERYCEDAAERCRQGSLFG